LGISLETPKNWAEFSLDDSSHLIVIATMESRSHSSWSYIRGLALVCCLFHGSRRSVVELTLAVCHALRGGHSSRISRSEVLAKHSGACSCCALFGFRKSFSFRLTCDTFTSLNTSYLTNRWSQPLAVVMTAFDFMKQFSMFATLALASRG